MDKELISFLQEVVGEDSVTTRIMDLVSYASDASLNRSRPEAALWPRDKEQIARILAYCNDRRIPVTPRGAGTSLAGLAVPARGGLVMDLSQMNRIVSISIPDRLAVVEPGVVYAALDAELSRQGFFFPPDPSSGKAATLGGNVATNAGGVKGAKYGTTKDYVLGLEIVLADGRIMRTGGRTMKTSSGYNLTQLFVGSEGTLGVITEITLKINPRPLTTATAMAMFDRVDDAGHAVTGVMQSGILPSVLEIIDQPTLKAINENTNLNLPVSAAMVLAETDGWTEGEADFQLERIIEVFKENRAALVRKAATAEEAASLWTARKSGYAVQARIDNSLLVEDTAVPMSRVAEILLFLEELSARRNVRIATVGHAGDGNLHPSICFDANDADEVKRVHEASEEFLAKVIEMGGTLSGEHGIGLDKAPYMHLEHDAAAMESMRGVKRLFDPNGILNPGKMALEA